MGNEASLEGGGQPGEPGSAVSMAGAPGSISAPPGSGQLPKPSNGAAAGGGGAAGAGAGISSHAGRPGQTDHVTAPKPGAQTGGGRPETYRLAQHDSPREQPSPGQGQGHVSRRSLQVDVSGRSGRSPSVSPDRGSAPTSPYSVPQIAPMPSSKLCPVCNNTDLTASHDQPNFNTCTQCHAMVCNQCGFNPNPHLTEVQEWLCLNCQMQRALGMDMTTSPRSKSQQQIHSPSHQAKPLPPVQHPPQAQPQPQPQAKPQAQPSPGPHRQSGPASQAQVKPDPTGRRDQPGMAPIQGLAKAPSQPDLARSSPQHQPTRAEQNRSAGSSPARAPGGPQEQPQDGLTGKLFGFGASLLNQASTLISVDPQPTMQPQPSPAKVAPKVVFSDASSAAAPKPQGPMPGEAQGKPGTTPHQQKQQQQQLPSQQQQQQHKQQQQQQPQKHHQQPQPHHQQPQQHHQQPQQHHQQPQQHHHHHPQQHHQQQPQQHHQQQPQQQPHKQQQQQPQQQHHAPKPKEPEKPKVNCPLCKTELNLGSGQPPNYNSCTQCHLQVCNLCGFNPTPHLVEEQNERVTVIESQVGGSADGEEFV
ncbi:protein bassoon-like [Amia ocellicauda]|uniref:protein bassoon-like n=1 Tax=Amia ocellicauda TaxID=2972642 RepID=UPI0034639CAA